MADFTNAVVTNAGAAAEATANANGWTIQFTRVQVGSGTGASDSATLKALTALRTPVTLVSPDPSAPNANLIGINNLVTYQVTVRFEISSVWVTTQFQLTEAGLWAKLNNGAEFLYAYAYAGTQGDIITASSSGSPVDNQYTFLIPYSNAPTISVTLGVYPTVNLHASTHLDNGTDPVPLPSITRSGSCPKNNNNSSQVLVGSNPPAFGAVPAHETQHLDNGSDPLPYPSMSRSGVVLPNPNDVTQVLCGSNPPSWNPGILAIKINTILYVAIGGNDSTGVPNDITHPFATVHGALNFLNPYIILPSVSLTISVGAGAWTSLSTISVTHPNASQISIIGTTTTKAFTGATFSSGTVTISAAAGTFSGWTAGNYVNIVSTTNAAAGEISGCWLISALAGDGSSISYTTGYGSLGSSLGSVTGNAILLQSSLSFSSGSSGIIATSYGLNLLQKFAIVGQNSPSYPVNGFLGGGSNCAIDTVGFYGWLDPSLNSAGISGQANSIFSVSNCCASRCDTGVVLNSSYATFSNSFFNSNLLYGFRLENSTATATGVWCMGNASFGFAVNNTSYLNIFGCFAYYNVNYGMSIANGSEVTQGSGGSASGNGVDDLAVGVQCMFIGRASGGAAMGFGTTNIGAGVLSTTGGWWTA